MRSKALVTAVMTGLAAAGAAIALSGTASSAVDHETCRPDGLYRTPNVAAPYCNTWGSVSYQGRNYQCRQAHTSLTGWEPATTPALWLAL